MAGNDMSEGHLLTTTSGRVLQQATTASGLGLQVASIKNRVVKYKDNYLAIISMYKLKIYLT